MLAHRFRFSFHLFKFFHFCRFIYSGDGGVCMLSVFYLVEVEALSDCIVFHSIFVSSVFVLFASSNWHTVLGSWQFIFFCLTLIFHVFHTFYFSCRRRMFYDIYCELLRNRARKFGIKIRNKNKTIFLDVVYVFFFFHYHWICTEELLELILFNSLAFLACWYAFRFSILRMMMLILA